MSKEKSIRVIQMKEKYISLFSNGYSVEEIAKRFSITSRTIYDNLQDIADSNGVSRNSLLRVPHKKHKCRTESSGKESFVNAVELLQKYDETIDMINTLLSNIHQEED